MGWRKNGQHTWLDNPPPPREQAQRPVHLMAYLEATRLRNSAARLQAELSGHVLNASLEDTARCSKLLLLLQDANHALSFS